MGCASPSVCSALHEGCFVMTRASRPTNQRSRNSPPSPPDKSNSIDHYSSRVHSNSLASYLTYFYTSSYTALASRMHGNALRKCFIFQSEFQNLRESSLPISRLIVHYEREGGRRKKKKASELAVFVDPEDSVRSGTH
ncbi:hypothetical protein TWF751_001555 [Orbilia oligospora]|nr:hypothetical protein TWF751_001555 [Orbilia oligospora]